MYPMGQLQLAENGICAVAILGLACEMLLVRLRGG